MELKEIYHDSGDIRLHGLEGPASGPPLLLLHGANTSCQYWMSVIPQLSQHWHLYAFDLRGHGLSGRAADLEGYNLSHNVADTVALLRDLIGEPAVLMGHSYGAVIAALTGMPGAEFLRGIVLEDPPLMLRRDNKESKLDYFRMVYDLLQTARTIDELIAVLSERNPDAPKESLRHRLRREWPD